MLASFLTVSTSIVSTSVSPAYRVIDCRPDEGFLSLSLAETVTSISSLKKIPNVKKFNALLKKLAFFALKVNESTVGAVLSIYNSAFPSSLLLTLETLFAITSNVFLPLASLLWNIDVLIINVCFVGFSELLKSTFSRVNPSLDALTSLPFNLTLIELIPCLSVTVTIKLASPLYQTLPDCSLYLTKLVEVLLPSFSIFTVGLSVEIVKLLLINGVFSVLIVAFLSVAAIPVVSLPTLSFTEKFSSFKSVALSISNVASLFSSTFIVFLLNVIDCTPEQAFLPSVFVAEFLISCALTLTVTLLELNVPNDVVLTLLLAFVISKLSITGAVLSIFDTNVFTLLTLFDLSTA